MKKDTKMSGLRKKAGSALELLDDHYPMQIKCFLDYNEEKPWQLLIATVLSAQCTDNMVNIVTKELFAKYRTIESFAAADLSDMEKDVKQTGFYRNKAKNIIASMRLLMTEYDGVLPDKMEELLKFPGVGRKTANVVLGHVFGVPGIVVDTHVKRISNRLGLVKNEDPEKIEFELMKILPEEAWIKYNTQVISFGREICKARKPECEKCFMTHLCICHSGNINQDF